MKVYDQVTGSSGKFKTIHNYSYLLLHGKRKLQCFTISCEYFFLL